MRKSFPGGELGVRLLALLVVGSLLYQQWGAVLIGPSVKGIPGIADQLASNGEVDMPLKARATYIRPELIRMLEQFPEPVLAIVSYDPEYDMHDDIVFNTADLATSRVLWANDVGSARNTALAHDYGSRRVLLIHLEKSHLRIRPVNNGEPLTWSDDPVINEAMPNSRNMD